MGRLPINNLRNVKVRYLGTLDKLTLGPDLLRVFTDICMQTCVLGFLASTLCYSKEIAISFKMVKYFTVEADDKQHCRFKDTWSC